MAAWYRETDAQKRKLKAHVEREKARGRPQPTIPIGGKKLSPKNSKGSPKSRVIMPVSKAVLQKVVAAKSMAAVNGENHERKKKTEPPGPLANTATRVLAAAARIKQAMTPTNKQNDKKCQIPTVMPQYATVKPVKSQKALTQALPLPVAQRQPPKQRGINLLNYGQPVKRPPSQTPGTLLNRQESTPAQRNKWWQWQGSKQGNTQPYPQQTQRAKRAKQELPPPTPAKGTKGNKTACSTAPAKGTKGNKTPCSTAPAKGTKGNKTANSPTKDEKKALREKKKAEKQKQLDKEVRDYVAYLHKQKEGRNQKRNRLPVSQLIPLPQQKGSSKPYHPSVKPRRRCTKAAIIAYRPTRSLS